MQISRKWGLSALLALAVVVPARAAELDRYVPANAEQVVVINVKQLLDSPFAVKHAVPQLKKQIENDEMVKKVMEFTGFDPLKDLSTIVMSNSGQKGDKITIIARGKYDTTKMHAVALKAAEDKKDELKISKLGDRHLYEFAKNGMSVFATFVDGTTAIVSTSKDNLSTALEGNGGKNKELGAVVDKVDAKQSIYMVGLIPEEVRKELGNLPQGPVDDLKKLKSIAAGITLNKGLAANLLMSTGDKDAAKNLADFADMAKGVLLFLGGDKRLAPLVNDLQKSLTITPSKGDVTISFKVGEEAIEKALKAVGPRD